MIDYILEIDCAPEEEDDAQARLFLTSSAGNLLRAGGITAYFGTATDRDEAAKLFPHVRKEDRPRTDWLERYRQSLKPLFIGDWFVVAPDAKLLPADTARHPLVIPQEQAFGTGSHESTALCIELLETIDLRGKRGLDIGAGSGILALAMRALGARKVIAFDIDLDAYGPLRDNAMRNRTDLALFIGTLGALCGGTFDVITMNILPEVIIPMLPDVIAHVGGSLIVSGILTSLRDDVVGAARGLHLADERWKGEWWAGVFAM